ncbi:MAG: BspA family leucine-rich repeat surface protein [Cyclobacteriaceae bacterium]
MKFPILDRNVESSLVTMSLKRALAFLLFLVALSGYAQFEVTNTGDSGVGSLRWCLDNAIAAAGTETITFNIPIADPNYNVATERWTIAPASDLPLVTFASGGVIIDASTQPGTATYRIILDGQGTLVNGLSLQGSSEVYGMWITNFTGGGIFYGGFQDGPAIFGTSGKGNLLNNNNYGIHLFNSSNITIRSNLIGTDPTGLAAAPNNTGIFAEGNGVPFPNVNGYIIGGSLSSERNIISGNTNDGIVLFHNNAALIEGNWIGVDATGNAPLPNNNGIVHSVARNATIRDNVVSGNSTNGVYLARAEDNQLYGNLVGVGADATTAIANGVGVYFEPTGSPNLDNIIGGTGPGEANTVSNNSTFGIQISNGFGNRSIANSIYCNGTLGVQLSATANNNVQPPTITVVTATSISGTGVIGEDIHVYRDNSACSPPQGQEYLGTTTVDGAGNWTVTGLTIDTSNDEITATATNVIDGTSEFIEYLAPFITTWKTDNPGTSANNQITIPTNGVSVYNYDVVWGDGMSDTGVTGNITHTYATPGTYVVSISGTFPAISFNNGGDREKILTVEQWGNNPWASMQNAFYGCTNLTVPAPDAPDLLLCVSMAQMFREATSFNAPIGTWIITGNNNSLRSMFQGATSFNQNISAWDVSGIMDMSFMFTDASAFNQPLTWANTSMVSDMSGMFRGATIFNQDLDTWNTANVIRMQLMFQFATSFNGNIDNWNVANVQFMSAMFSGATAFNRDISGWVTNSLTTTASMFQDATNFNRNLSGWNVSGVTSMSSMFANASSFNQPLTWDGTLSMVNSMSGMFLGATSFDQDISNWDVSGVTTMSSMFNGASDFNQDLSSWDVSGVTSMFSMFLNASSFNQSLGSWDISPVTAMDNMLSGSGLSIANYDATLIGWESLDAGEVQIPTGVNLDAVGLQYCAAAAAHANLMGTHTWTINDSGFNCPPLLLTSVTPLQNAIQAPLNSNLTFVFDNNVDGTTANNSNIIITGEQTGTLQGSFSGGGTSTITFNPANNFKPGEIIRITLTTGLQTAIGNVLPGPVSYKFQSANQSGPEIPDFFLDEPANIISTSIDAFQVHAADIDNDGDIDVAAIGSADDRVVWFRNDGSAIFTEIPISSTGQQPKDIFASDFDMDGDVDLLVSFNNTDEIVWFDNNGSQLFTERTVGIALSPEAIVPIDVDGDGDLDVISANEANGEIAWYENDGAMSFALQSLTTSLSSPRGVYPADIDSDGDIDILASDLFSDEIIWFENDGSQSFTPNIISGVPSGPWSVFAVDFDLDGDMDLLSGSEFANEVAWYENDGSENFSIRSITTTASGVRWFSANDIDADGDLDVVTASDNDDKIAWYENDGSFTFSENIITSNALQARGVFVADMDGDGDLDIVSASEGDDKVAWYDNNLMCPNPPTADANADVLVCPSSTVQLSGTIGGSASGATWTSSGTGSFNDNTLLDAIYTPSTGDETNGSITLTLTVAATSVCPEVQDQMTVTVAQPLTAASPDIVANIQQAFIVDVVGTSIINNGDDITVTITQDATQGTTTINTDNTIFYTADVGAVGNDSFDYEICNQCGLCSVGVVAITIAAAPNADQVIVRNGISPNGDGKNDYFVLENIENAEPLNKVFIYNRWGDVVFEIENYDSTNPDKRFNGIGNDGEEVTSGVYFYKVEFGSGREELTGYLSLKK